MLTSACREAASDVTHPCLISVSRLGNRMPEFIGICEGPERFEAPPGAPEMQSVLDRYQRVQWIESLAPWSVMFTGTFRWEASVWSAGRCFEKFMHKRLPGVSWFEAIERNPSRYGYHVHALWADCKGVFRKEEWASWFKKYGRCKIELVRNKGDVSEYASKYLSKPNDWWNVYLQWHRMEAIRGQKFGLCGELAPATAGPRDILPASLPYSSPPSTCVRAGPDSLTK